jgi:hypothetical protein
MIELHFQEDGIAETLDGRPGGDPTGSGTGRESTTSDPPSGQTAQVIGDR